MPGKWLGKTFLHFGIYLRVDWGQGLAVMAEVLYGEQEPHTPSTQALKRQKEVRGSLLLRVKWCIKGQGFKGSQREPWSSSKKVPG